MERQATEWKRLERQWIGVDQRSIEWQWKGAELLSRALRRKGADRNRIGEAWRCPATERKDGGSHSNGKVRNRSEEYGSARQWKGRVTFSHERQRKGSEERSFDRQRKGVETMRTAKEWRGKAMRKKRLVLN